VKLTVILVVPCPEVNVNPEGRVHANPLVLLTPDTANVAVPATPARHDVVGPPMVPLAEGLAPLSIWLSQLSSIPLHSSLAPGLIEALLSSQSPD
jgi:hypothetical protein